MQSFHHSRGRIVFEVLCAFGMTASCVFAWRQTGASALLAAASISTLYGFVHLFELRPRRPAETVEPQRIDFEAEIERDLSAHQNDGVRPSADDQPLAADNGFEEPDLIEPAAPQAKAGRPAKAPRKGGSSRASVPKEAKLTEPAPADEAEATELASPEEAEVAEAVHFEETAHISHAPLFEPAPFVRQQRAAFGRKAG